MFKIRIFYVIYINTIKEILKVKNKTPQKWNKCMAVIALFIVRFA